MHHRAGIKVSAGTPGSSPLSMERYTSKFTHRVVGRIQFFKGCWTKGLGSLLAIGQGPPSVLGHMNLSIG